MIKEKLVSKTNFKTLLILEKYFSRYPRGQQRPSSLASSHKQLIDRHQQLMINLSKRKVQLRHQQRILNSCSQRNHRIMMLSRNSEKCQEWMNNWNID